MSDRFVLEERDNGYDTFYLLRDTKTGGVVGTDMMEPEDVKFYRDLAWVVDALNALARGEDPKSDDFWDEE